MSIPERIRGILKAQVLDFLDIAEDTTPLDSARKDIDDALNILRGELGRTLARKYRLTKALPDVVTALNDLAQKAEVAISHGVDDLARAAIARRQELEVHMIELREGITVCETEASEFEDMIRRLSIRSPNSDVLVSTSSENLQSAFEALDRTVKSVKKPDKESK